MRSRRRLLTGVFDLLRPSPPRPRIVEDVPTTCGDCWGGGVTAGNPEEACARCQGTGTVMVRVERD